MENLRISSLIASSLTLCVTSEYKMPTFSLTRGSGRAFHCQGAVHILSYNSMWIKLRIYFSAYANACTQAHQPTKQFFHKFHLLWMRLMHGFWEQEFQPSVLSTRVGHWQWPFDLSSHFFIEAEQRENSMLQNPENTALSELFSSATWSWLTFQHFCKNRMDCLIAACTCYCASVLTCEVRGPLRCSCCGGHEPPRRSCWGVQPWHQQGDTVVLMRNSLNEELRVFFSVEMCRHLQGTMLHSDASPAGLQPHTFVSPQATLSRVQKLFV